MPLKTLHRDDLAGQIEALAAAILKSAAAHGAGNVEYCRGALDFAQGMALANRINWADVLRSLRTQLDTHPLGEILDTLLSAVTTPPL